MLQVQNVYLNTILSPKVSRYFLQYQRIHIRYEPQFQFESSLYVVVIIVIIIIRFSVNGLGTFSDWYSPLPMTH